MTQEELNQKYTNLAAKAGDLALKMNIINQQYEETLKEMNDVNKQAIELKAAESADAQPNA